MKKTFAKNEKTKKVTLDVNFWLSALLWEGSVCNKLLMEMLKKGVRIFTCEEIIEEFSSILTRDFNFTVEEVLRYSQAILKIGEIVELSAINRIIQDDPEDDKIIACAIESNSDHIISYDRRHLLSLKDYKGIKIIKPEEAIKLL